MTPTASTRILLVGDMHLGRLPGSLPGSLDSRELGPRAAWERVIQAARDHRVHCVALAGDLVEGDNALFEAYGILDDGVRRLTRSGIRVVAVAGNHDTLALPQLAQRIEDFHLLGPGGTWSTVDVAGDGAAVRLVGWSFPAHHHRQSPLDVPCPAADPAVITFGLLHADLDAPGSSYAPVSRARLVDCGYRAWFLGHVHLPDPVTDDGTPFYLGSLTPLRPTEQGSHGPVLASVEPGGRLTLERLPLAPLRWQQLEVDCTGLSDPRTTLKAHLLDAARRWMAPREEELEAVQAVGLRVNLTGTVAESLALREVWDGLEAEELQMSLGGIDVFIDRVACETTAPVDLAGLARHDHPAGILARQILVLQDTPVPETPDPDEARRELIRLGRQQLNAVDGLSQFLLLRQNEDAPEPTDEDVADLLLSVAREALNHLLAGKEGGHASL